MLEEQRKKVKIDNNIIKEYYKKEPPDRWKDYRSFYMYFRWKFYKSKDVNFFMEVVEKQNKRKKKIKEAMEKAIEGASDG